MTGQAVVTLGLAVRLAECVLVDDIVWSGLEDTGGDPGLENKPTSEVDTTNLLAAKVEL